MSGNLLRTAVYANPNTAYFLKNGDTPYFPTIDAVNINASTIVASGGGEANGAGVLVLNGNPIVFSGSGDYDNTSMGIQQAGSVVIPYGGTQVDPNVIQIFCEGTASPNVPGKILTGGVYFNPQQSFINPSTICSQIYGDASGNIFASGLSFNTSTIVCETVNGKPVASPSKVAYVGVSGTGISVPAGASQTITDNFSVVSGHTYRVTVQCQLLNTDATAGVFTELLLTTNPDPSVQQVGLGSVFSAGSANVGEKAFTAVFVATANSSQAHVVCFNSSATDASVVQLNATEVANAPSMLVEDLGVI